MNVPKVLAVDDSVVIHHLVKRALEPDYDVLATDSPVDALAMLNQYEIAVVLLDVTMPTINGLEICRTIRNLPQFQHLPVVIVTSRDRSYDRVQGHLAGATEYLTKPFEADHLRQVVQKLINQSGLGNNA